MCEFMIFLASVYFFNEESQTINLGKKSIISDQNLS